MTPRARNRQQGRSRSDSGRDRGWAGLLMERSFLQRLRREATYVGRVGWLGLGVVEGQALFAVRGIGRTAEAVFWDARIEQTSWPFPRRG